MGVYEDMANDAGYPFGTDENRQMAQSIEEAEQEAEWRRQAEEHQMERNLELANHREAVKILELELGVTTDKDKVRELMSGLATTEALCLQHEEVIDRLRARVRELEADNTRLKTRLHALGQHTD